MWKLNAVRILHNCGIIDLNYRGKSIDMSYTIILSLLSSQVLCLQGCQYNFIKFPKNLSEITHSPQRNFILKCPCFFLLSPKALSLFALQDFLEGLSYIFLWKFHDVRNPHTIAFPTKPPQRLKFPAFWGIPHKLATLTERQAMHVCVNEITNLGFTDLLNRCWSFFIELLD